MTALVLLAALLAADQSVEARLSAIELTYAEAEFEEAAAAIAKLLQTQERLDLAQRKRLYVLAGFTQFFLNREREAEKHFEALFRLDQNATIDEKKFPPKALGFFQACRDKFVKKPEVARPASQASGRPAEPGFSGLSLIPFGIGQLALGDPIAGSIFLILDAGLLATSLSLYWLRHGELKSGDQYVDPNRARIMQIAQDSAAFALIAVSVIGVIDAAVATQKRVAERKARRRVTVAPLAAGLSLGLEF